MLDNPTEPRTVNPISNLAKSRLCLPFLFLLGVSAVAQDDEQKATTQNSNTPTRTSRGLLALYEFNDESKDLIQDSSGAGEPIDLEIETVSAVDRSTKGTLRITAATRIRSQEPPRRILSAVRRSAELTIEAWVRPENTSQDGPARIISLSKNSGNRNFTLGQEGDRYDVRLRTTRTSGNGIPSTAAKRKSVTTDLTHVVYTRTRRGVARIYVNGKEAGKRRIEGKPTNWDPKMHLLLGNENGDARPWLGTYHLVALFERSLSTKEIERHYRAGAGATSPPVRLAAKIDPRAKHFESKIAPLLSHHCLECHDTATRKGKLDLSRKDTAFATIKGEPTIVPGDLEQSRVWATVAEDDMPKKRPPLSAAEKKLLSDWIDAGAVWSLDRIDPAVYAHGDRGTQSGLRRLTVPEYVATVKAALGVDIAKEARATLPPDLRADGFSNTAYNLTVDLKHVEAYAKLAETIVSRIDVEALARRFSKSRRFTDDDMGRLISGLGKWLLRGPLEDHEIVAYRGITTTVASAGGDFKEAVGLVIEAMLQSPRFIYRIELQRGDGALEPADDFEVASRLSFLLWGAPPDEQLLQAAENAELDDAGIDSQIERMLNDPRAVDQSKRFFSEWLDLDRLENLNPNRETYPGWSPALAGDMRAETLTFFEELVWRRNRPLAELLNTPTTFVSERLARHYGLPDSARAETQASDSTASDVPLAEYDLSEVPGRGGLLTHGSVLTIGGDEASMVTRGLFVLHELLRGVVKDPPPCVDTTPKPTKPGISKRSVAMERVANRSCGGCHSRFEPLAYGLEKFDGLGAYHETDEHGNTLREDGEVLFPGEGEPRPFQTSKELMDLLAKNERVQQTITWKLTQFAVGRPLVAEDAAIVGRIHRMAQEGGGTYASLVRAIAQSDLVRLTRTESVAE